MAPESLLLLGPAVAWMCHHHQTRAPPRSLTRGSSFPDPTLSGEDAGESDPAPSRSTLAAWSPFPSPTAAPGHGGLAERHGPEAGNVLSRPGQDPKHTRGPTSALKEYKYAPNGKGQLPDLETQLFQLPPCFSPTVEIQHDFFSPPSPALFHEPQIRSFPSRNK